MPKVYLTDLHAFIPLTDYLSFICCVLIRVVVHPMDRRDGFHPDGKYHGTSVILLAAAENPCISFSRVSNVFCQLGARFGPMKCTDTYVGKSLPALVTNLKEAHPDVRAYTLSVLRERLGSVQSAWQHSSDNFYKNLWANGQFLSF